MEKKDKCELLAPAGDAKALKAAVSAGADAVYFGLEKFGARTRAVNICLKDAPSLIQLAHKHNSRTYLTINTLILDEELDEVLELTRNAVEAGIDAVIVQDMGLLMLLKLNFPQLELHASTQMTTHNTEQCELLAELGVSQVNLSRELSLSEIELLSTCLKKHNIVSEVFVHGAYCISYSGQCYFSGTLYGEQGNRGSCVQPCRREYRRINNSDQTIPGKMHQNIELSARENIPAELRNKNYCVPFHLKDNGAFPLAEKLINAGAGSLKIEGRIKNAEYVWAVTSSWKEQLQRIQSGKAPLEKTQGLEGAVNRDYTCGYLEENVSDTMFSSGEKDLSLTLEGEVNFYHADSKTLSLSKGQLLKDDRITIKTKAGDFVCTATVESITQNKACLIKITNKLSRKIEKGQQVFKSKSIITEEALNEILKPLDEEIKQSAANKKENLQVEIEGIEGKPLKAVFSTSKDFVEVCSSQILSKARNEGLSKNTIEEKFKRLGETPFNLASLNAEKLEKGLYISPAELNAMRRQAVEKLSLKLSNIKGSSSTSGFIHPELIENSECSGNFSVPKSSLGLICSSVYTAEKLLEIASLEDSIILEMSLEWDENTELFLLNNERIIPMFQAILFEKDLSDVKILLNKIKSKNPDIKRFIFTDNAGLAHYAYKIGLIPCLGSNLNITNSASILSFKNILSIKAFVPSQELSPENIDKLCIPENVEVWYPLYNNDLLLQSRQCLVHTLSDCKKRSVTRDCILNCSKSISFEGKQHEKLRGIKRRGFYSSIFQEHIVSNKQFAEKIQNTVNKWLIDLRLLPDDEALKIASISINDKEQVLFGNKELFEKTCARTYFIKG